MLSLRWAQKSPATWCSTAGGPEWCQAAIQSIRVWVAFSILSYVMLMCVKLLLCLVASREGGGGSECPGTQELPRVLLVRPPLLAAPQPILSVHQQLVLRVWSILPWLFAGGAPETDPTVILYPMSR